MEALNINEVIRLSEKVDKNIQTSIANIWNKVLKASRQGEYYVDEYVPSECTFKVMRFIVEKGFGVSYRGRLRGGEFDNISVYWKEGVVDSVDKGVLHRLVPFVYKISILLRCNNDQELYLLSEDLDINESSEMGDALRYMGLYPQREVDERLGIKYIFDPSYFKERLEVLREVIKLEDKYKVYKVLCYMMLDKKDEFELTPFSELFE